MIVKWGGTYPRRLSDAMKVARRNNLHRWLDVQDLCVRRMHEHARNSGHCDVCVRVRHLCVQQVRQCKVGRGPFIVFCFVVVPFVEKGGGFVQYTRMSVTSNLDCSQLRVQKGLSVKVLKIRQLQSAHY